MAWPLIAAAAVGAIAGGQKDSATEYSETSDVRGLNLRKFADLNKGQSGLEKLGYNEQLKSFKSLQTLFGLGPGANEVSANTQYQNTFASQLQSMLSNIANPNAQQNFAQAQQLFAPQQTALNQQFEDQGIASNRLAARLGRPGNDPILRNKLMQEQTRQQTMLNSQIGSYAQQLPYQQAQQFADIGGTLSNLRQGLATQAFQNRQTLLGLGQSLTNSERQYRINTAQQYGSNYSHGEALSGGGLKGMIGGAGAVAGTVSGLMKSPGGK